MSKGSVMFSSAFSVGPRLKVWNTNPTVLPAKERERFSSSDVRSVSPMKTLPDVRESSPARQWSRVDLPEPEGP
jgi:hypothetical protein